MGQMNKQIIDFLINVLISGNILKEKFLKMYNKNTKDYYFFSY